MYQYGRADFTFLHAEMGQEGIWSLQLLSFSASLAISRKTVLDYLRLAQLPCMTSWDRGTRIS